MATVLYTQGAGPIDEDAWDDSELIKAYDESIKAFKARSRF